MLAPVELALKPGGRGQPRGMVYLLKGWILLGIFFVGVSAEARCRTWLEPRGRPRAVAVVAHGMNLRADRMRDLSELLRSHGAAVMQVGFRGHCGVPEEYYSVTVEGFLEDARAFHAEASLRARREKVPLVLVAYSFSAAVFLRADLPFARMALFAPALAAHWWTPPLLGILSRLPAGWRLRSVVPEEYRANSHTSPAAFHALRELMRDPPPVPGSALVLIDPGDELVHAAGVAVSARARGARVEEIRAEGREHHLLIDRASVGDKGWGRISSVLPEFLLRGF